MINKQIGQQISPWSIYDHNFRSFQQKPLDIPSIVEIKAKNKQKDEQQSPRYKNTRKKQILKFNEEIIKSPIVVEPQSYKMQLKINNKNDLSDLNDILKRRIQNSNVKHCKVQKQQIPMKLAQLSQLQPSANVDRKIKENKELLIKVLLLKIVKQKVSDQVSSIGDSLINNSMINSFNPTDLYGYGKSSIFPINNIQEIPKDKMFPMVLTSQKHSLSIDRQKKLFYTDLYKINAKRSKQYPSLKRSLSQNRSFNEQRKPVQDPSGQYSFEKQKQILYRKLSKPLSKSNLKEGLIFQKYQTILHSDQFQ